MATGTNYHDSLDLALAAEGYFLAKAAEFPEWRTVTRGSPPEWIGAFIIDNWEDVTAQGGVPSASVRQEAADILVWRGTLVRFGPRWRHEFRLNRSHLGARNRKQVTR